MEEMVEKSRRLKPPVDSYGRAVTHLRVSVTERCNLHCPYCHKEGMPSSLRKEASVESFIKIITAAGRVGIRRSIKITGGEPLLRRDLERIIEAAKEAGFSDISLTTNGRLLTSERAHSLKEAGLMRVNIGCDAVSSSFIPKTYEHIRDALRAAADAHLTPIKLNMVVLKGINERDVEKMLEIAHSYDAVLQLIELIETEERDFYRRHYIGLEGLEEKFSKMAVERRRRPLQNRTVYRLREGATVEFVRPTHNASFCSSCPKLRITSDARIKTCLMRNDDLIEFRDEGSILAAVSCRRPFYG